MQAAYLDVKHQLGAEEAQRIISSWNDCAIALLYTDGRYPPAVRAILDVPGPEAVKPGVWCIIRDEVAVSQP